MPTLVLICGLPGSGKTTRSKQLADSLPALHMNADAWITTLLPDVRDVDELDRLRTPVESLQWGVAKRALVLGINVVIDWGFWAREERDHYRAEAEALGAKVVLHYLEVSLEELWARLAERNANLPPHAFHITKEQLELWSTWFQPPTADELA